MKVPNRYVGVFVWVVLGYIQVSACDVCGSSVNANYFGILPQYGRHFAGLRYSHISSDARSLPSLFESTASGYTQTMQRMECWGRYYPAPRLQLFAFVPYQYNTRRESGTVTAAQGLSDISLMANYILLNTGDSGWMNWRHTFTAGGGLKVPTGKFDPAGTAALQTGSGSWDWMMNAIYTLRYRQVGINADINVRINTTALNYRYGNRVTSSLRFFYWRQYKLISLLPHVGMLSEWAAQDQHYGIRQRYTGGYGYYPVAGLDIYLRRISFGMVYTQPFSERLNNGYASTNQRTTLQLIYLF